MYLHRPGEAASRSRFWLALSLSTVTAAAVAAPLALKAVSYDAQRDPAAPGGTSVPVWQSAGLPNPHHRKVINDPGRRYKVGASHGFQTWIRASVLF